MPDPCAYGEPQQGDLGRYPCFGGCGCWMIAPGTCLACWAAAKTYSRREVLRLDDDDPRRRRVRGSPPG